MDIEEPFLGLPRDIFCAVLARLPVEALLNCKCVCKRWYDLIEDPFVINLHVKVAENRPSQFLLKTEYGEIGNELILLDTEEKKIKRIPLEGARLSKRLRYIFPSLKVMCSCNGLLCAAKENTANPVVILNPVLGEYLPLPSARLGNLSKHHLGFGVDHVSGQYKVFRAYKTLSQNPVTRYQIFTLGEKSWRPLENPNLDIVSEWTISKFWHGALYWIVDDDANGFCKRLLTFDLYTEMFHSVHFDLGIMSVIDNRMDMIGKLGCQLLVASGSLTLVVLQVNMASVWKIIKNENEVLSISFEDRFDTKICWNNNLSYDMIDNCAPNGFLLLCYQFEEGGMGRNWLVRFYPKKGQYIYEDISNLPYYFAAISYRPSLVSPIEVGKICDSRRRSILHRGILRLRHRHIRSGDGGGGNRGR